MLEHSPVASWALPTPESGLWARGVGFAPLTVSAAPLSPVPFMWLSSWFDPSRVALQAAHCAKGCWAGREVCALGFWNKGF